MKLPFAAMMEAIRTAASRLGVTQERVTEGLIKRHDHGSGLFYGRHNINKGLTLRRASGPGSYDYEALVDIVNRKRKKAGLPLISRLRELGEQPAGMSDHAWALSRAVPGEGIGQ